MHIDLFFKAKIIYVYDHERKFSALDKLNVFNFFVKKILNLNFIHRKIKPIDSGIFIPSLWESNRVSIDLAKKLEQELSQDRSFRFIHKYLGKPPQLMKFYMARYVLYLSRVIHVATLLEALRGKNEIIALLAPEEFISLEKHQNQFEKLKNIRTKRSLVISYIQQAISNFTYRLEWYFLPILFLFYAVLKYRFTNEKRYLYKVLMQMHWGVPGDEDKKFGRYTQHDYYLYGEKIQSGDILHYYDGAWAFPENQRAKVDEFMEKNGYLSFEKKNRRISLKWVISTLILQKNLITDGLSGLLKNRSNASIQNVSAWGLLRILDRQIDLLNFQASVYFDRVDYNPSHIIDTIVLNQSGTTTIGLHHCASPYDSPQIAFVFYNHYIALGEMFTKPYLGLWDDEMVVKIGRLHVDWAVNVKNDHQKCTSLKNFAANHYGKNKYYTTLVLPGEAFCLYPERWQELENGLKQFSLSDLDVGIFVRFRSIENSGPLRRIWDLCEKDVRLITDHENYTTYDCLAISDLVIANNCSSAINEAVAVNSPVFTFDFTERPGLLFKEYGTDFILKSGQALFDRLQNIENIKEIYDVDWELLTSDSNYTSDGRNEELIRNYIADLLIDNANTTRGAKESKCINI